MGTLMTASLQQSDWSHHRCFAATLGEAAQRRLMQDATHLLYMGFYHLLRDNQARRNAAQ